MTAHDDAANDYTGHNYCFATKLGGGRRLAVVPCANAPKTTRDTPVGTVPLCTRHANMFDKNSHSVSLNNPAERQRDREWQKQKEREAWGDDRHLNKDQFGA